MAPLPQTRATEHIGHQRSVWSDRRSVTLGLDSFLASTCCSTTLPFRPPCSLKVFHLNTLLLSYIFGLVDLQWSETLCLSLSLSEVWTVIGLALLYNFICPCFDFIRWRVTDFVFYCIVNLSDWLLWLGAIGLVCWVRGGWGPWGRGGIFELGEVKACRGS